MLEIIEEIKAGLDSFPGTLIVKKDDFGIKVSLRNEETYTVSIRLLPHDETMRIVDNVEPMKNDYTRPKELNNHIDILDAVIYIMSKNDVIRENISGVTIDGDHKSCEAIFMHKNQDSYLISIR